MTARQIVAAGDAFPSGAHVAPLDTGKMHGPMTRAQHAAEYGPEMFARVEAQLRWVVIHGGNPVQSCITRREAEEIAARVNRMRTL